MASDLFDSVPEPLIISDSAEVAQYLDAHVGVTLDILDRSRSAGYADAAMATPHSVASYFGWSFYNGSIEQLRRDLASHGWVVARPDGLEAARRHDNRLQIVTTMGDAGVGDVEGKPRPLYVKGPATGKAIDVNQQTFVELAPSEAWKITTWWMLYRVSGGTEPTIKCELSLPVSMYGRKWEWAVRLILPELKPGPGDTGRRNRPVLPQQPDPIQVNLQRRGG